ncbi:Thioredoxin 1 [Buchnera aphidicola (Eriosoma lanigerum)]|uniref:thioredoxin n=1 Tax=Buchnera aphidicola TaxID=9 RepID=UPI003463E8BE
MSNEIVILDDNNFENYVSKQSGLILVDFWANWCNPCKLLAPILDNIAEEYHDHLIIAKLDVENNPNIGVKYSIQSIPTLLLFRNNHVIDKKIGMISKKELKNFLDINLNS